MADAAVQGRILWYELLTTDMKAAEKFYSAVVGWSVSPMEGSPQPYDMWMRNKDAMVGGVMTIPEGMNFPPHWGMYVGVQKLEDGIKAFEKAGGKSLSPIIEVPGVGRMRTMLDPQGAAISVYEPSREPQPEATAELGGVSWHELYTTDAAAALKFYQNTFGWKERSQFDMGPMGKYLIWGRDWDLGGMMNKMPEMANVPPHWGLYFLVKDVNEGAEKVKANGGRVLHGPMSVPDGSWIVNCVDPQGAHFSLNHR